MMLLRAEEREIGDLRFRGAGDPFEQADEVADPAIDRRGVEEIGRVLDGTEDLVSGFAERPAQVELRGAVLLLHRNNRQIAEAKLLERRVLEREERLEERASARVAAHADGIDEEVERDVFLLERREARGPDAAEEIVKARRVREIGAQDVRIDEEPDERLELRSRAVRDRRTYRDVGLSAQSREEDVVRREEDHEERGAVCPPELSENARKRGGDSDWAGAPAVSLQRRPRTVGGEIERGAPEESAPPFLDPPGEACLLLRAPLPEREIGEIERQRRERRGEPARERAVEGRHFAHEDADRPAVRDDVVHRDEEHVLVVGHAE